MRRFTMVQALVALGLGMFLGHVGGTEEVAHAEVVAPAAPVSAEAVCGEPSKGEASMARLVRARERDVEARERSLERRETILRDLEGQLTERARLVTEMAEQIQSHLGEVDEAHALRIKGMAKRVEAMRSKQAAAMFANLFKSEPETAILVLRKMSVDQSGKMMSSLDARVASRVSKQFAEPLELELP
ncbi:MAG: MotE family protein [Myxococcota bacterium]